MGDECERRDGADMVVLLAKQALAETLRNGNIRAIAARIIEVGTYL